MNNLFIYNSGSKQTFEKDVLYLTETDFHPCRPFFIGNGYSPESFTTVYTKGVFEIIPFLREAIKKTDYLLTIHGKLVIEYFMPEEMYVGGEYLRPLSFFMHELSISVGTRFKLRKKTINGRICHLVFEKIARSLPKEDLMDRWSFGIVSDGRKNDRINSIIRQIHALKIPEYEILICGPPPGDNLPAEVRVFDDCNLYWDIRPPITSKKNRLIRNSRYNNLVLIHDRISFPSNWFRRMKSYGNFFEILCVQILDEDTLSRRVQDWLKMSGDLSDYQKVQGGLLEYDKWTPEVYVDGGCLIAKKHILEKILYNESLHWGEAEDVDISKRLYQAGVITNFYKECSVTTATRRHEGSVLQEGAINKFRKWIGLRTMINRLKRKYQQSKDFVLFINSQYFNV